MPRGYRNLQVSFAGGEMSPEMFARHDDDRFRSGAARLRNMISRPKGPAARRPGFGLVQQAKDSTHPVRLLPFRFSADDAYAIEMGRHTVDAREIGYFRFHTEGGTLLQPYPDAYREPLTVLSADNTTEQLEIETSPSTHDFQTGDPIVFTMTAQSAVVTFFTSNDTVVLVGHGFRVGDQVLFTNTGGALPAGLVEDHIYFVREVTSPNGFTLSRTRGGQLIDIVDAGTGVAMVASLPSVVFGGVTHYLDANTTFYAIRVDGQNIQVALTKADAIALNTVNIQVGGLGTFNLGDIRVHYDYRPGSVAFVAATNSPFYCFKIPWGTPGSLDIDLNDHLDHGPASFGNYWMRQSGTDFSVTFTPATDRVNWTTHNLLDGDPVTFTTTGTLPPELTEGTVYYVRNKTTNDFQLSASVPGAIINLTTAGTPTTTAFAKGFYEVPHFFAEDVLFEVNFAQSNDVLTLVHQDRPVAELRREGAARWVLRDVVFNGEITPPTGVEITPFFGEGHQVTAVTAATPAVLTTTDVHTLTPGEQVQVEDVGDIPNGHYIAASGTTASTVILKAFDTGAAVGSTVTTVSATSIVRSSGYAEDWDETYAVTALGPNDNESAASATVTVSNNLLVSGAQNTITWETVPGALRYRVYKDFNGLLGFIGEVDAPSTTFLDDNIEPDLSITPPILDNSLRTESVVTFSTTADTVSWPAHGLEAGAPVVFDTNGTLPTNVDFGVTYYVLNPSENEFQLTTTPTGTTEVNISGSPSGIHTAVSGFFPAAVGYFEQRRVFAGARLRPQDFWATASGTESDLSYTIPSRDSNRLYARIAARERSQIRHIVPAGHLLLLTSAAEYRITPLDSDALTPGSVSARAPTHVGVSSVAPVVVNNVTLFPSARGSQVRELGYYDRVGDYVTSDVTLRASHLFEDRTVVQLTFQQSPHPIVWAISDTGTLLGLTYIPEEQVAGWHEHDLDDATFESCVSVTEGQEDRLYVVTNRGGTRYIERMGRQEVIDIADCFYVDFGATYDGTPLSSLFFPHLASQAVVYLADGIVGTGTVSASGMLTLATAASKVHVGLPYDSELHTLPIGMQVDAALGSGRTKNVNNVYVRAYKSGGFEAGPSLTTLSDSPTPDAGTLLTDMVQVVIDGEWDLDGQVYLKASDPLPLTVVGLTLELASGG